MRKRERGQGPMARPRSKGERKVANRGRRRGSRPSRDEAGTQRQKEREERADRRDGGAETAATPGGHAPEP